MNSYKKLPEIPHTENKRDDKTSATARPKTSVIPKIPRHVSNPNSTVRNINIGEQITTFQMTPTWFQPEDRTAVLRQTIYPDRVPNKRVYDTIACYRSASTGQSTNFKRQPLNINEKATETLILSLDAFAELFNGELSFTNEDLTFNNSVEQIASGIANMGSIHLLATDSLPTAVFSFQVDLDYQTDLLRTPETLENFILGFSAAIADALGCAKDYVRMFSVEKSSHDKRTSQVNFGLTLPEQKRTIELAKDLQRMARNSWSTHEILHIVKPAHYSYKQQAVLSYLQLRPGDFDPRYNNDYTRNLPKVLKRGNQPYHLPIGWFRHGLNVSGKYDDDDVWLGDVNRRREWPVAYHGTYSGAVSSIAKEGLSVGTAKRDVMEDEAIEQLGSAAKGKGLYLATHCDGGSHPQYTKAFSVNKDGQEEKFHVVFQCRVRPHSYSIHKQCVSVGLGLRVVDPTAIRPYGLLLKKETDDF